jgi:hypothetical protein
MNAIIAMSSKLLQNREIALVKTWDDCPCDPMMVIAIKELWEFVGFYQSSVTVL